MENYNLLKKLGASPNGPVYLVQLKSDGSHYAMKRFHCSSEADSEAKLRMAANFGKLQHAFVSKYREFFVGADDKSDELHIYVVMEYFPCGEMGKLFKQRHRQQKPFGEMVVKKWFGQMVEALIFVHERDIVHGDFKPTNVFMTEDLNISIGDFSIKPAEASAASTASPTRRLFAAVTSIAAGIAWAPPECKSRPPDDRADIYALGCILLQLVTCHLVDETKMLSLLTLSKTDPRVLEELLQQIMVCVWGRWMVIGRKSCVNFVCPRICLSVHWVY